MIARQRPCTIFIRNVFIAGLVLCESGCHIEPQEGQLTCLEQDCPEGWICSENDNRCYSSLDADPNGVTFSDTDSKVDSEGDAQAEMHCGDGICNGTEDTASCHSDCGADCGDGACNGDEETATCPLDCGSNCGDGVCDVGESTVSCAEDCGLKCGDMICDGTESSSTCHEDCGSVCGDGDCNGSEATVTCYSDCGASCGDSVCNGDETTQSCAEDCGLLCGDGSCNGAENTVSCHNDCGSLCGDEACNGAENTVSCHNDCGSLCGDGACNGTEGTSTCSRDCGSQCGDGRCNGDEATTTCPEDCGSQCGDGTCNGSEGSRTCPSDCGSRCGDGTCNGDEGCSNCENDCGACCIPDCTEGRCGQDDGCGNSCPATDVDTCEKCGNPPCGPTVVFIDDFENGLGRWDLSSSGDWFIDDSIESIPAKSGNYHAEFANDADGSDKMATGPIDTSTATKVTLSFWAYIDDSCDDDEDFLQAKVLDGSDYDTVLTLNAENGDDNDKWEYHELNITSYKNSRMWILFKGKTNSSEEKLAVDLVKVTIE